MKMINLYFAKLVKYIIQINIQNVQCVKKWYTKLLQKTNIQTRTMFIVAFASVITINIFMVPVHNVRVSVMVVYYNMDFDLIDSIYDRENKKLIINKEIYDYDDN